MLPAFRSTAMNRRPWSSGSPSWPPSASHNPLAPSYKGNGTIRREGGSRIVPWWGSPVNRIRELIRNHVEPLQCTLPFGTISGVRPTLCNAAERPVLKAALDDIEGELQIVTKQSAVPLNRRLRQRPGMHPVFPVQDIRM